jgi:hypothetical protein
MSQAQSALTSTRAGAGPHPSPLTLAPARACSNARSSGGTFTSASLQAYSVYIRTRSISQLHRYPPRLLLTAPTNRQLPGPQARADLKPLPARPPCTAATCPLGVDHPPAGQEFSLGCWVCRSSA